MLFIENNIVKGVFSQKLLTATVPDGVTKIDDNAFRNCQNLQTIYFPPSLTSIGNNAFEGCEALQSADLTHVSSIGNNAFFGCVSLKEVKLGSKIGYLCNAVFEGCTSLHDMKLPKNLTYIGCECFKDCTSLAEIDFGEVREIDNNAFEHCTDLCSISLPKSVMHISPNAFSFCSSLTAVTVQSRAIDIDETAFENTVNIIIKAVQFSTSHAYAAEQGLKFVPAIFNEKYRKITSEQVAALKEAKIMFQMKVIDSENAVIRYDEVQKIEIESIIGKAPPPVKSKIEPKKAGDSSG